jgi:hypothetical protein
MRRSSYLRQGMYPSFFLFHFQASTPIWVFKLLDLYSFPYAFDTYAFEAIETFIL